MQYTPESRQNVDSAGNRSGGGFVVGAGTGSRPTAARAYTYDDAGRMVKKSMRAHRSRPGPTATTIAATPSAASFAMGLTQPFRIPLSLAAPPHHVRQRRPAGQFAVTTIDWSIRTTSPHRVRDQPVGPPGPLARAAVVGSDPLPDRIDRESRQCHPVPLAPPPGQ